VNAPTNASRAAASQARALPQKVGSGWPRGPRRRRMPLVACQWRRPSRRRRRRGPRATGLGAVAWPFRVRACRADPSRPASGAPPRRPRVRCPPRRPASRFKFVRVRGSAAVTTRSEIPPGRAPAPPPRPEAAGCCGRRCGRRCSEHDRSPATRLDGRRHGTGATVCHGARARVTVSAGTRSLPS
jgi:hypothetical protein